MSSGANARLSIVWISPTLPNTPFLALSALPQRVQNLMCLTPQLTRTFSLYGWNWTSKTCQIRLTLRRWFKGFCASIIILMFFFSAGVQCKVYGTSYTWKLTLSECPLAVERTLPFLQSHTLIVACWSNPTDTNLWKNKEHDYRTVLCIQSFP